MEARPTALSQSSHYIKRELKRGVMAAILFHVCNLIEHFQAVVSQWFRFSVKGKGRKYSTWFKASNSNFHSQRCCCWLDVQRPNLFPVWPSYKMISLSMTEAATFYWGPTIFQHSICFSLNHITTASGGYYYRDPESNHFPSLHHSHLSPSLRPVSPECCIASCLVFLFLPFPSSYRLLITTAKAILSNLKSHHVTLLCNYLSPTVEHGFSYYLE